MNICRLYASIATLAGERSSRVDVAYTPGAHQGHNGHPETHSEQTPGIVLSADERAVRDISHQGLSLLRAA